MLMLHASLVEFCVPTLSLCFHLPYIHSLGSRTLYPLLLSLLRPFPSIFLSPRVLYLPCSGQFIWAPVGESLSR
ncbi:hypothetical protein C8R47DRAFT_1138418 [Mycena vitilis]|nr:hypothetical protein C8R47DRAFT_1138418 [Mycena vitilis]